MGIRYVCRSETATCRAYASGGRPAAVSAMDARDVSSMTALVAAAASGACAASRCENSESRPSTCRNQNKSPCFPPLDKNRRVSGHGALV